MSKATASSSPKKKKRRVGISEVQQASADGVGAKVLDAAKSSKKVLGMHVSAAGGLQQSVYNAVAVGCRGFALFVRNQRTWNCKSLDEDVVEAFARAIEEHAYPLKYILPHGSYLINPGSSDSEKLEKSRAAMLDECQRCERLGIMLYNIHPGSTVGLCSKEECIKTVAATLNYVIERTKFVVLVLETMAGQGSTVGGTFEELRQIIDLINNQDRVGICIDTCHIFAAGYDIRNAESYSKTMDKFDEIIGFKFLKGLHLNDSKGDDALLLYVIFACILRFEQLVSKTKSSDLGCNLDRHANIGSGKITIKGFTNFMNDDRLDGLPMILETPAGKEAEEMIKLYNTVKHIP
uniref:AP_endonuc_2 domain-containing protein n=1 Tax=Syphacia muris TaxID=451379 RepID=A0A0N5AB06_9BILA